LRKEFDERLDAAGVVPEWGDIVRDVDRVEDVHVLEPHQPDLP